MAYNPKDLIDNKSGNLLPDDFPKAEDQVKAIRYWTKHGVNHLIDIDEQVERFRYYHKQHMTEPKSWTGTWRTWYTNARNYLEREDKAQSREKWRRKTLPKFR